MPYSFYGPNTRSDFLCYFLDMAIPIKSVEQAVIMTQYVGFCASGLTIFSSFQCLFIYIYVQE